MSLADTIASQIRAERTMHFASLGLPSEWITPNYGGRSIVNVPASIINIFGGRIATAPLDPSLIEKFSKGVKRIVLVVVDALGYQRFRDALERNPHNGFHALLRDGAQIAPLTSVFPSTTTAALTALWSGYTPAEHGFMGYVLYLREYGIRSQMITFDPAALDMLGNQQLVKAGLEPEKFLAVPSLPQTLLSAGVPVYNFIEQPYVKSALSRVQIRGQRETCGFVSSSDMWIALRGWLEQRKRERALFVAYWSAIDTIAHTYGPSSETLLGEIDNFAYSFEREFLSPLSLAAREGTLFLLTADHGQIDTPIKHTVYIHHHPELRNRLLMDFTGDPRAAYLYCRNGETEAARAYVETRLADKFFVLDSQAALRAGLFGGGTHAPEAPYRIGDLILLPHKNYILWDRNDAPKMLGRHGGLTTEEMLVPLLVARLDG